MPAPQFQIQQLVGFDPRTPGSATLALNAAATWLAVSFIAQSSAALNRARLFVSALSGSLGATDLTLDLASDVAGAPGTTLESRNTLAAPVAAGTWAEWTGFSTALTAGTAYWLVVKNVNATPATNSATFRYGATGAGDGVVGGSGNRFGYRAATTTTSGGSWSYVPNSCGWRVQLAGGNYQGLPTQNITASADLVYQSRESGVQFVTPGNAGLNVMGLAVYLGALTGAPAGGVRLGLWTGAGGAPVNVDYTTQIPATTVAQAVNSWVCGYFVNGVHTLNPGTTVRVTLAGASGNTDNSTNAYKQLEYTLDSDAASLALVPWSLQKTYFNGSTWTQTATALFPFALLLDTNGEFVSTGGTVLVTPARKIIVPPPTVRRRSGGLVLAGPPVVVPLRPAARYVQRTVFVRRNAGASLFPQAAGPPPTVLVTSVRLVR